MKETVFPDGQWLSEIRDFTNVTPTSGKGDIFAKNSGQDSLVLPLLTVEIQVIFMTSSRNESNASVFMEIIQGSSDVSSFYKIYKS